MLDFTHHDLVGDSDTGLNDNAASTTPEALDPLSLRVVHLARAEAWRSMATSTARGRLWHWFLGDIEQPRHLANPRLEMLRNFCTYALMGDERSDLLAATMLEKGHYNAFELKIARDLSLAA